MTSARLLDLGTRLAQALAGEGGRAALLRDLDRGEGLLLFDALRRPLARTESAERTPPTDLPAVDEPARLADGSLALPLCVGQSRLGWLVAFGPKARRADEDALRLAATLLALDLALRPRTRDRQLA